MYFLSVKNTLAKTTGAEIAARNTEKPFLVLADASGSMDEHLPNGNTRFSELRAALGSALSGRKDYKLVCFGSEFEAVPNARSLRWEGGGTMLAKALEAMASVHVERILIATDGEPTDYPTEKCLTVLDELYPWVRVDVLYIGAERGQGEILMRKVARNGGSVYTTRVDYLGGIKLLLEDTK